MWLGSKESADVTGRVFEVEGGVLSVADGWQHGARSEILLAPATTPAANPGFDITPARLVTALITERGVCEASEAGIGALFPG